jgi:hypothetical protein
MFICFIPAFGSHNYCERLQMLLVSGEEKGEEDERGNEDKNTSGYEEVTGREEWIITTQSAERTDTAFRACMNRATIAHPVAFAIAYLRSGRE